MNSDSFKKVKFWERQLIINKQVQAGMLGYSVFLVFAVLIGQYLLQTFVLNDDRIGGNSLNSQHVLVYFIIFVFFVLVALYGMYLTNQIAGPIHRLKSHLEDLKAGKDAGELTFRKGDYFREILESYNSVVRVSKK